MYGLFIGTTISSVVLFVFRIIPISTIGMIMILYLYAAVGGITGYIAHRKFEDSSNVPREIEKKPEENPDNPPPKEKVNPTPVKQEIIKIENYRQKLDEIKNLKRTSLILKGLVNTRKRLEELKKESNSILEDSVEIMDNKSADLTKSYLKTS